MDFFDYCRQNTGELNDGGDIYGRKYELPPIPKDSPLVYKDVDGYTRISTAVYLDTFYKIRQDLIDEWKKWDEEHTEELEQLEGPRLFLESKGYKNILWETTSPPRLNVIVTHTAEHDLDQEMLIGEYTGLKDIGECIHPDLFVIHIHTGFDIRGGYTTPVICESKDDCIPLYTTPAEEIMEYCG